MRHEFARASDIPPGLWRWPHFDAAREWADRLTGRVVIETTFLDRLEHLRSMVGFPLPINSGYRTPAHNAAVSTTGDSGPHVLARAGDVKIYGPRAVALVGAALQIGFTGIGVQQKGDIATRYIHLDDLTEADGFPRPTIWSY